MTQTTLKLLGPDQTPEGRRWRINGYVEVAGMNGAQDCRLADVYHEPTAKLFAVAPEMRDTLTRFLGIRAPNSGKWTREETERSFAALEEQARALLARIAGGAASPTEGGGTTDREWTTKPDPKAPHLAWVVKIRNGRQIEQYNGYADWPERAAAVAEFLNDFEVTHPEVR